MLRILFTSLVLWGVAGTYAQTINLRGSISNSQGQAIEGAVVHLLQADLKDSSGNNGAYNIQFTPTALLPHPLSHGKVKLVDGILTAQTGKPVQITLEIYDVQSRLLKTEVMENARPGRYRWNLTESVFANKLLIVLLSIENKVSRFRYLPLGIASPVSAEPHVSEQNRPLAKTGAAVDTLVVSAGGYFTRSLPLSDYDAEIDVILYEDNGKTPPGPSAGCGKPLGNLSTDYRTITSEDGERDYYLDIPEGYNPNHPYRLFFAMHWGGGDYTMMVDGIVERTSRSGPEYAFYGLKHRAELAGEPAIFLAPNGIDNRWTEAAHPLFDNLLAFAKENLCIDTTRVFSTGFSYGGMITYSLSSDHQKQLRAVVGIAPANYNIYIPEKTHEPIAYMSATGMSDNTCPWDAGQGERGAKYALLEKARDNGCDIPDNIPTTSQGSRTHMCYEFEGCMEGYPVVGCTFDGGHIANIGDGGTGNVGGDSWVVKESWDFFAQF